jgi:hypothetical protein
VTQLVVHRTIVSPKRFTKQSNNPNMKFHSLNYDGVEILLAEFV